MKGKLLTAIFLFIGAQLSSQYDQVDSIISSMTIDEKIGQLFMIRAFSHRDPQHITSVQQQIDRYHVGGVCFFQGSPMKQIDLVNNYQSRSPVPLLIAIDGEWGLGMRFPDEAFSFPRQITLGAVRDNNLVYRMGREIARQCRKTGINVNFAPVIDVNNNRNNPVINMRSFGEDPYEVAAKGFAYMKGLADENVIACAKHFPGHGDTDVDSHYDLPIINHSRSRLDSIELYPFRLLSQQGLASIMVAHLNVPALDTTANRPTTLSRPVITNLLRREMSFDGLIFTDAMEMKGVTKHFPPGEADVEAFLAGNDIITLPENMDKGFRAMKKAYKSGRITEQRINESVRRILIKKQELGLFENNNLVDKDRLADALFSNEAQQLKSEIYEKALTLVQNQSNILPLRQLHKHRYASLALGSNSTTDFQKRVSSYIDCQHHHLDKEAGSKEYQDMLTTLEDYDIVFISLHDMSWYANKDFGINQSQIDLILDLSSRTEVVLTVFGTPYAIEVFENIPTLLVAYEDNDVSQNVAAQSLFGVTDINGKLPVTASEKFHSGIGMLIPAQGRMGYSRPEWEGLNKDTLRLIDKLMHEMISKRAAPGAQVLIARNNKIVWDQCYGYHDYNKSRPVRPTDIYDVASVTKILATTISLMHLDDQNTFDVNAMIKQYIPEEDTTNKANIKYSDMLAHVSGLAGWIPFYKSTLTDTTKPKVSSHYYRSEVSDSFSIMVTPDLFLRTDYQDSIWRRIFSSQLNPFGQYKYSDLGFYIANRTIYNLTGMAVSEYAEKYFYRPLGLHTATYNPLEKYDVDRIPPTESDNYFRGRVIKGTVHDMGAAMLGGISGHAGLFSNARDLAILMQMLVNQGYYGGTRYISAATVRGYTQRHALSTRRGLGFDMKELDGDRSQNMSELASSRAFGHLGFTGTCVLADPEYDLVIIILTNRTFPSMKNNKFGRDNYRPRLQSIIYRAISDGKQYGA